MKITWYGHAAFGIEGHNAAGENRKVILDPYNYPNCGGYLPVDDTADVVSVSHDNPRYHSDVSSIRGHFEFIDGLEIAGGSKKSMGILFSATEVYENAEQEGPNAMVKFELDGLTVAHQGDLGHALEGPALDFLKDVDILLALAGGPPTIDLADLIEVIDLIRPAVVIPMHYKTPKVNLNLMTVDHFLRLCSGYEIERLAQSTIELGKDSLPSSTRVLVLEYAR